MTAEPAKRPEKSHIFAREAAGRRPWSSADFLVLREQCTAGVAYCDIAASMDRSLASIQIKAGRLGISNGRPLGPIKGRPVGRRTLAPLIARTLDNGNAAELIACADIILAGHRAYQAAQGLPYDVVADIDGRLIRVGVKSAYRVTTRPEREGGRRCYQFAIHRSARNRTNPSGRYTGMDFEVCALVALDIRQVIYLPARAGFYPTSFHVDPPSAPTPGPARTGITRKHWAAFPLSAAVQELFGRGAL